MHLFLCPSLEESHLELPPEEAHHAVHVLRLRVGDRIGLLDGRGTRVEAELTTVDKSGARATVLERTTEPAPTTARVHLAVAPTKQADRFEWFVEKAVELGVDRITPMRTERTERTHLRHDRLLRVAIAAMKQSQRLWLPAIDETTDLDDLLSGALPGQRYFGWCRGRHVPLAQAYRSDADAVVLIGPEGDFSDAESGRLIACGCLPVSLGTARLRTETAALAACTWMSLVRQG
jgi:16S rRNA (uracil1498-N3)-methyltransferase